MINFSKHLRLYKKWNAYEKRKNDEMMNIFETLGLMLKDLNFYVNCTVPTDNKDIFVRPNMVCLFWRMCLFWEVEDQCQKCLKYDYES